MKIGQVVREYGVSVNRLYFYINNGLLVPPRKNSQYDFDGRTLEDLRWILELKEMEFPLKTIHRLLSLRRISNLCSPEDRAELRSILAAQAQSLARQEAHLGQARARIQQELARLEEEQGPQVHTGVPVEALRLLCCPCCGGELAMDHVTMSQRYIFQAELSCGCGYRAAIQDGVLETEHRNTSPYDKPDTTRELYRDLPSSTLSLFERSYRWLEGRIAPGPSGGRVWFEGYVTAWFFLHNHLELLRPDDLLIIMDKFPETLRAYKQVLEEQKCPCPVLYLADASTTPPLRRGVIHCCMDFFATNEHSFWDEGCYLAQMKPYFHPDCQFYGVYFSFHNGPKSMARYLRDYPGSSPHNFHWSWFLRAMEPDFVLRETEDCGCSLDSGTNLGLGFHIPGEELHLQAYWGILRKNSEKGHNPLVRDENRGYNKKSG